MPLPILVMIVAMVAIAALPLLLMASVFESDEKRRRDVGRCHFVE